MNFLKKILVIVSSVVVSTVSYVIPTAQTNNNSFLYRNLQSDIPDTFLLNEYTQPISSMIQEDNTSNYTTIQNASQTSLNATSNNDVLNIASSTNAIIFYISIGIFILKILLDLYQGWKQKNQHKKLICMHKEVINSHVSVNQKTDDLMS